MQERNVKLHAEGQASPLPKCVKEKGDKNFWIWHMWAQEALVLATVSQPGWLAIGRLQASVWVVGTQGDQQIKLEFCPVDRCVSNAAQDFEVHRAASLPQRLMLNKSHKPGKVEHSTLF